MANVTDEKIRKKVLDFFTSLADETRLKILLTIAAKPKNVNDIHKSVGKDRITLSGISHQLTQLSDTGIVKFEKYGKEKVFRLSDDFCWCILKDAFKQFNKNIKIKCEKCEHK